MTRIFFSSEPILSDVEFHSINENENENENNAAVNSI